MKVADALVTLTKFYNPDDQIIMAHWDKEGWEQKLTDEQWAEVVRRMEHLTENILEDIHWKITETIQDVTGHA